MMAQAAHSSLKLFLDRCKKGSIYDDKEGVLDVYSFYYKKDTAWDLWLNGLFTKIVVSCKDEEELDKLYQQAKNKNLPCTMIIDAGLTEFKGIPTKTCIAIGPAFSNEIDEITKHLELL
jgi:PTH2 family peptidyl-tRNA hydrolase